jgi:hypothetical protein
MVALHPGVINGRMAAIGRDGRGSHGIFFLGTQVKDKRNTPRYSHVDGICPGHTLDTLNDLSIVECQKACDENKDCYSVLFAGRTDHMTSETSDRRVTSACILKADDCQGNTRQYEMYVKRSKEVKKEKEKDDKKSDNKGPRM